MTLFFACFSPLDSLSPRLQEFVECTTRGKGVVPQRAPIRSAGARRRGCCGAEANASRVSVFWGLGNWA